jgi:hypothetical protein
VIFFHVRSWSGNVSWISAFSDTVVIVFDNGFEEVHRVREKIMFNDFAGWNGRQFGKRQLLRVGSEGLAFRMEHERVSCLLTLIEPTKDVLLRWIS